MAKLSKSTRERMAKALVRHRFQTRADELLSESAALFDAVYEARYDAPTRSLMGKLEKLHPKAFSKASNFTINARGMRVSIGEYPVGAFQKARWERHLPSRSVFDRYSEAAPDALVDRIAEYGLATKAFDDELSIAYARALSTIGQLGTAKRLQDEWPEALPVIGELIPTEDRTLPVVQLAEINAEFDLPPEVLAA